jgi:hypothetical protein
MDSFSGSPLLKVYLDARGAMESRYRHKENTPAGWAQLDFGPMGGQPQTRAWRNHRRTGHRLDIKPWSAARTEDWQKVFWVVLALVIPII